MTMWIGHQLGNKVLVGRVQPNILHGEEEAEDDSQHHQDADYTSVDGCECLFTFVAQLHGHPEQVLSPNH